MNISVVGFSSNGEKAFLKVRGRASGPQNPNLLDSLIREVKIVSPGVPQIQTQSGFIGPGNSPVNFTFTVPSTAVPGTIKFEANVYPTSLTALIDALKNLLT
jgi:hypothetical protein